MMAGEFAVLEPHQRLAVMAVNRFVYATIVETETNRLSLENFGLDNLKWQFHQNRVMVDSEDPRIRFVQDALTIACQYLHECSIMQKTFKLSIKSELDDASGRKYGLGSSAAVVVAVIAAVLEAHLPEKPSKMLIFKLAAISHVNTQGNGSGADVAASSFGGILEYASFQASWLKEVYAKATSITEVVHTDWKYLAIHPVKLPDNIVVRIGWTGSPASTGKLVDQVLQLKVVHPNQFAAFLQESEIAVRNIMNGIKNASIAQLFKGIRQNRQALATVGKHANVAIETPQLTTLCDLTEQFGGAGKPSGAGGGDCGMAFMPSVESANRLTDAWKDAGIVPLDIAVCPFGAQMKK